MEHACSQVRPNNARKCTHNMHIWGKCMYTTWTCTGLRLWETALVHEKCTRTHKHTHKHAQAHAPAAGPQGGAWGRSHCCWAAVAPLCPHGWEPGLCCCCCCCCCCPRPSCRSGPGLHACDARCSAAHQDRRKSGASRWCSSADHWLGFPALLKSWNPACLCPSACWQWQGRRRCHDGRGECLCWGRLNYRKGCGSHGVRLKGGQAAAGMRT